MIGSLARVTHSKCWQAAFNGRLKRIASDIVRVSQLIDSTQHPISKTIIQALFRQGPQIDSALAPLLYQLGIMRIITNQAFGQRAVGNPKLTIDIGR